MLKKGTASAEQVTVSFYVKGNAAALYVCELYDGDNGRVIAQSFAVTTSWNRIELTFAADTTGAFDDDNAPSLYLNFWLHAGATYAGGTFSSNTWAATVQANRAAVDGFTSIFDATSRTLFITGVQMELGATATEFESRTFGEELALCQRYVKVYGGGDAYEYLGVASVYSGTQALLILPISMRAAPSVTISAAGNWSLGTSTVQALTAAVTIANSSARAAGLGLTVSSGLTDGQAVYVRGNGTTAARLTLSAEL